MKTSIILRSNEVAAVNDVLGSYGSEKRVTEIQKSRCGMVLSGSFDPEGNYCVEFKIQKSLVIGMCQIALDHSKAIKGLVKAIDGIIDTINYLGKNISRDIKNLLKEYEEE